MNFECIDGVVVEGRNSEYKARLTNAVPDASRADLDSKKEHIKFILDSIRMDCASMIKRIDAGSPMGLGGSLQNTWDLYMQIGQYEEMRKIYERQAMQKKGA